MMEDGGVSKDAGHTSPVTEGPDATSTSSSPTLPPPCLTPKLLGRPKPQLPSRPPLPSPTPPSLPPPLTPVPTPPLPISSGEPPQSLPPPLSPTPASPPPISTQSPPPNDTSLSSTQSSPPCPSSLTATASISTLPSPVITSVPSSAPLLSETDRLQRSTSVWKLKGISQDQTAGKLEKESAGAFLVHSDDGEALMLSVRLPDEQGPPLVHSLTVKQHQTFVHLEGSSLVFDDIVKLISFYCASRDILTVRLRLPEAITKASTREELEVIAAAGADFWTSDLNEKEPAKTQETIAEQCRFLYVNPVAVEEKPNNDSQNPSGSVVNNIIEHNNTSTTISTSPTTTTISTSPTTTTSTSAMQNGEATKKERPEVKVLNQTKSKQEIKYKRPPPRPPSLGSGAGLSFSSSPLAHTAPSVTAKKEEGKGGGVKRGGEKEERKSVSSSPIPSKPPPRLQSRAAPPLPPAPVPRVSSRKHSEPEGGDGSEKRKGKMEKWKEGEGDKEKEVKIKAKAGLLFEEPPQENCAKEEIKEDGEKKETEDEKEKTEVKMNKEVESRSSAPQCPPVVKRPSRPVPPPRRKTLSPDTPVGLNQTGGGLANQSTGSRIPPASPGRRPDVSLYSPQGSAVVTTDPDSCSTSSAEEDGDMNQEQEQNHSRPAESRSPKTVIRRTPTTVILDRARHRLSTVLTGLISHDRRLTQRIVEMARDPLSYFGNLVKEHRTFTLETMSNHSTTTELLQEIRQMMTQLKSYLLQSAELQAMLEPQHQYTQDKLENIAEAALCKSVLKPIREQIYQCLEKLHNNDSLKQLTQNQSAVLGSTTTALGVTTAVPEASAMEKISIKLNKLHYEYSPQKKIELLLKACKIIYDCMSVSCPGRAHGADDFLPVMMYVLARCNLSALQLDVEYMMELMDPSLTIGEGSYYLTTTYGALEHIKTFDQQRSATRQLSREVQDSIHRWERRRTLNQERMAQGSDFLTVCCPEIGTNPKTLGVLPTTTIEQLAEQCAVRFEQEGFTLSVYIDGVQQPCVSTDLALSVKSGCQPGGYCFLYHPVSQPSKQPPRSCPTDPPPAPPAEALSTEMEATEEPVAEDEEEESLISL
ncbi:ras and Rab interactor 3 isoform X2 [Cynoglossus semilaevis]|uniref:ras and Rab interactor 3 isoform X2 n=1 Tax=Cynoglossus semilaevis TaxID=244447 RepID=UPI000D629D48|nr:ras and Rab interactor 3-like isoform X2 [Cynoglossus semilaevis]